MRYRILHIALIGLIPAVHVGCSDDQAAYVADSEVSPPPSIAQQGQNGNTRQISLSNDQAAELKIKTQTVKRETVSYMLKVPGEVFPAPENISIVSAPVNGRVAAIHAHEGEAVRKGQVLLELESLEFANLVAEYLQARAGEAYQQSQLERLQQLAEKKISPQRALEKAEADYARANAASRAAQARLLAVGVSKTGVEAMYRGADNTPRLKILAGIDGMINEHLIEMGQAVTAYDRMLTVLNLRKVLVRGYASPEDGMILKPGDQVSISLKDLPELTRTAAISTINPALDATNKSITLNILVDTPDAWPKPGQHVRLDIRVTTPEPVLAVPLSAVEYEGSYPTLFVQKDTLTYEKRHLQIARLTGEYAIVRSGLEEGETVAVSQVFSLKALSKFEEFAE